MPSKTQVIALEEHYLDPELATHFKGLDAVPPRTAPTLPKVPERLYDLKGRTWVTRRTKPASRCSVPRSLRNVLLGSALETTVVAAISSPQESTTPAT